MKITAANFAVDPTIPDAVLSPDDPMYDNDPLRASARNLTQFNTISTANKGKIQQEKNIKPGTEEWFKLWFGK